MDDPQLVFRDSQTEKWLEVPVPFATAREDHNQGMGKDGADKFS